MPNWLSRIKWAIRDGGKFRILLLHLREFVDNIIELVPVSLDVINDTVEEDITTIVDISTLRLAESACEESYPRWSTRASEVIKESEIGTLDRRNFEEISRDVHEPQIAEQESVSNTIQDLKVPAIAEKVFLVFTDECLDLEADSHCEVATIGTAVVSDQEDISFTCESSVRWNLGRRILRNVKPSSDSQEKISEAESRRMEISKITGNLPDICPIFRIYVHCGPCACAVQTALKVTRENGASKYFDFAIRIDERLPTSCRRSSTAIDVLAAIHHAIDGHVVFDYFPNSISIGCIDCPELENSIYNLEQENVGHFGPGSVLQQILAEYDDMNRDDIPIEAIILIAEAGLCHLSLEGQPFRAEARKPRDNDIFAFDSIWKKPLWEWERRYMGSYSRSKASVEKRRARESLLTDLIPPATTPPTPRNKRPRSESTAISDD
ncbi:hypothetical protein MMC17_008339 [Xylographa soralifera]|nr:hypothetical protein [Xylographa soralifera]